MVALAIFLLAAAALCTAAVAPIIADRRTPRARHTHVARRIRPGLTLHTRIRPGRMVPYTCRHRSIVDY